MGGDSYSPQTDAAFVMDECSYENGLRPLSASFPKVELENLVLLKKSFGK